MPFQLQKTPLGVLGAFDLKQLGANPNGFEESIRGSVDVLDFYLQPNRSQQTVATAGLTVPAAFGDLAPAPGEIWRVKGISIVLARNVADVALTPLLGVQLIRGTAAIGGIRVVGASFPAADATALLQAIGFWLPRTILLSPGDILRGFLQSTLTVAATAGFSVDVDIFPQ